jgi:hypothetical protein
MAMTTSSQLKQPQVTPVLEYYLLQHGWKNSPAILNLVRTNPELCDFYKVNIF